MNAYWDRATSYGSRLSLVDFERPARGFGLRRSSSTVSMFESLSENIQKQKGKINENSIVKLLKRIKLK